MQTIDVAVVGASAAGLFAAIHAGRTARLLGRPIRISAFDGARKLGAKILVAGGGRCNVTHWRVTEQDFSGSSAPAIRKVLGRFTELDTATFFEQLGVSLKREETGKLFPASNSARTVLNALLREAQALGVELIYPARIRRIDRHESGGFHLQGDCEPLLANRVILCTGGKALPKSGSDGEGFALACHLGHTLVEPIIPALVPLVLEDGHWITALSGLTLPAELFLKSGAGKRLVGFASSTLCTHFGMSGPSVLDISRHYLRSQDTDPHTQLLINWLPGFTNESLDELFLAPGSGGPLSLLRRHLPDRLARQLATLAGIDDSRNVPRERRRLLATLTTATVLPVIRDRGFTFAEATAGGVPLSEVRLETMESRVCPGLSLAGEVLDVDGRIGGFNFQWAWSSGFVAGTHAAKALMS